MITENSYRLNLKNLVISLNHKLSNIADMKLSNTTDIILREEAMTIFLLSVLGLTNKMAKSFNYRLEMEEKDGNE